MKSVLLLNASYEVLRAITMKRAVVLVLQQKAEIIEASEEYVRSESFEMKAPSVIRLKYYVTVPWKAKVALNRRNLTVRDGGACQRVGCTRKGDTIDHVHPRSRGGRHEWANVTLLCSRCNQAKSDKLLSELNWSLKTTPSIPSRIVVIGVTDPAWEPHLSLAG